MTGYLMTEEFTGAAAVLELSFRMEWTEPDESVGEPGGWSAALLSARLGDLCLDRAQLVAALGEAWCRQAEERRADSYAPEAELADERHHEVRGAA